MEPSRSRFIPSRNGTSNCGEMDSRTSAGTGGLSRDSLPRRVDRHHHSEVAGRRYSRTCCRVSRRSDPDERADTGPSRRPHHRVSRRRRSRLALIALILFWGANFSLVKLALRDLSPLRLHDAALPPGIRRSVGVPQGGRRPRADQSAPLAGGDRVGSLGTTFYQVLFDLRHRLDAGRQRQSDFGDHSRFHDAALADLPPGTQRPDCRGRGRPIGVGNRARRARRTRGRELQCGALTGDLAVLVAAAAWSAYTVGSVPLVHRYGVVPVTAATMWVGTLGLVMVSLPALLAQDWAVVRPISWLAVLYSGAFAIATAYFLWYFCIRQIGSTRTAVYTNFTPVVALLVAWPALGEVPTALQAAGAGGIISGRSWCVPERSNGQRQVDKPWCSTGGTSCQMWNSRLTPPSVDGSVIFGVRFRRARVAVSALTEPSHQLAPPCGNCAGPGQPLAFYG